MGAAGLLGCGMPGRIFSCVISTVYCIFRRVLDDGIGRTSTMRHDFFPLSFRAAVDVQQICKSAPATVNGALERAKTAVSQQGQNQGPQCQDLQFISWVLRTSVLRYYVPTYLLPHQSACGSTDQALARPGTPWQQHLSAACQRPIAATKHQTFAVTRQMLHQQA